MDSNENLLRYTPLFSIVLIIVVIRFQPALLSYTENLVYGKQSVDEDVIEDFTSSLAKNPDIQTLHNILLRVTNEMNIPYALLFFFHDKHEVVCLATPSALPDANIDLSQLRIIDETTSIHQGHALPGTLQTIPWASLVVPLTVRNEKVGVLITSAPTNEPFVNERNITILSLVADVIAVGYDLNLLIETILESSAKKLKVREDERIKLAQQLHNDPLNKLSRAMSQLQGFDETSDQTSTLKYLQEASSALRQICRGLRPPVLGQNSLEPVLVDVVHKFRQQTPNVKVHVNFDENDEFVVGEEIVTTVYYISMEILNNVAKHAQASAVWLDLSYRDEKALISIWDDGVSSPKINMSVSELARLNHEGIIGMREWAKTVNGLLKLYQRTPSGTLVSLEVPIN